MTPKTGAGIPLDALLDSRVRNNIILVNLLRILPEGGLDARATKDSPSVAQLFTHVHCVRLVFISENAPCFAEALPAHERDEEWRNEPGRARIAQMLNESARAVRNVVRSRVESNKAMDLHYHHPVLFLRHMIWHEGYRHGQIKLALKLARNGPIGAPYATKQSPGRKPRSRLRFAGDY